MLRRIGIGVYCLLALTAVTGCGSDEDDNGTMAPSAEGGAKDPSTAPRVQIDRFSSDAAMLMVRTEDNGLPAPGEPIDFDQAPFITTGYTPDGTSVSYYNFDVQPVAPAPIFALFREGDENPVEGQLNIVDVIPGDAGYNDFWLVTKVTVPSDYVANSITNVEQIVSGGYEIEATDMIVNCPIVPEGSTAVKRLDSEDPGLTLGWYQDQVVAYFNFSEAPLTTVSGSVPVSPIYVTFNVNPDEEGGGPGSGFVTEEDSEQTHNVIATIPGDAGYSPLWSVNVYDNADFASVSDLASATAATSLATGVANVNCPVVSYGETTTEPVDVMTAERQVIDRFSAEAATLMVRTADNGLPAAGEAIDFDQAPFITTGLQPDGSSVRYYNFDVQPLQAAPIYVLFREGEEAPVEGQLNIVDVVPGDEGYNDFWVVNMVTVPADYVANTVTSLDELLELDYSMEATDMIVNCPIVPEGSTATLRLADEDPGLTLGWYQGKVVSYFNFSEAPLTSAAGTVPVSPIYVTFNINPDQADGGPASGFLTEDDGVQTHNVIATVPGDAGYSPLWSVNVYDNADFASVADLESVQALTLLAAGVANVNCPVVATE